MLTLMTVRDLAPLGALPAATGLGTSTGHRDRKKSTAMKRTDPYMVSGEEAGRCGEATRSSDLWVSAATRDGSEADGRAMTQKWGGRDQAPQVGGLWPRGRGIEATLRTGRKVEVRNL